MTSSHRLRLPAAAVAVALLRFCAVLLTACDREEGDPLARMPRKPAETGAAALGEDPTASADSDLLELLERRTARRAAELAEASTPVMLGRAPTAVALAEGATTSDEVLVWRSDGVNHHTWWLVRREQAWQVAAQRPGLWLAGRDDVYGWTATPRAIRVCDAAACAGDEGACQPAAGPPSLQTGRIDDVALVGLRSGRKLDIGPRLPPTLATQLGTSSLVRPVSVTAQFDGYLLVRMTVETADCGPLRGTKVDDDRVLQTRTMSLLPLVAGGDEPPDLAADLDAAREQLQSGPGLASGQLRWKTTHLALAAAAGSKAPQSTWQVLHEFAVLDGSGAVQREARMPARQLPQAWQEALDQAPPLGPLLSKLQLPAAKGKAGADPHAGWSWVRLPPAARAALREVFAAQSGHKQR